MESFPLGSNSFNIATERLDISSRLIQVISNLLDFKPNPSSNKKSVLRVICLDIHFFIQNIICIIHFLPHLNITLYPIIPPFS